MRVVNLDGMAEIFPGILGLVSQLLFDAEYLVVLGQTLRAAWSPSLDLACAQANDQVSNESVFGFATAVGHHGSPPVGFSKVVPVRKRHIYFISLISIIKNRKRISMGGNCEIFVLNQNVFYKIGINKYCVSFSILLLSGRQF